MIIKVTLRASWWKGLWTFSQNQCLLTPGHGDVREILKHDLIFLKCYRTFKSDVSLIFKCESDRVSAEKSIIIIVTTIVKPGREHTWSFYTDPKRKQEIGKQEISHSNENARKANNVPKTRCIKKYSPPKSILVGLNQAHWMNLEYVI